MLTFFQKYKNVFFILGLTICLVLFSYVLLQRDIWYDEAYSGIAIRLPWGELWNKVIHDVHPPLYYLLLKIWSIFWGSDTFSIRSFSMLLHVLSLFLFFHIAKFYLDKIAYLATAVFALSPFFLGYATEARMYTLLCFFVFAGALLLFRFQYQQKKYITLILSSICFALGALTHYFGLLAFASAFFFICTENKNTFFSKRSLTQVLLLLIPFFILFLPWLPFLLGQLNGLNSFGWIPPTDLNRFPESLAIFYYGNKLGTAGESILHSFFLFFPPIILFSLFVVCIAKLKFKNEKYIHFLLSFTCIPFFLIYIAPVFGINLYLERYLLPFGAFLILCSVTAFYKVLHKTFLYLIFAAYFIGIIPFYYYIPLSKDYSTLLPAVKNIETLVMDNPFDYTVSKFYYPEKNILLLSPENDYTGWNIIDTSDVIKTLPATTDTAMIFRKNNPDGRGKEVGDFIVHITE
ncbi:MAG: glycosyltransferase family 39 protein [Candidatus Gracilibacteria bacterium]